MYIVQVMRTQGYSNHMYNRSAPGMAREGPRFERFGEQWLCSVISLPVSIPALRSGTAIRKREFTSDAHNRRHPLFVAWNGRSPMASGKNTPYACRCLNVRIASSLPPSAPPQYPRDPNYTPVFVKDDGISVVGFFSRKECFYSP